MLDVAAIAARARFVVDAEQGLILTNRHVVTVGPVRASATFQNKEEVECVAVYRYALPWLCVLRKAVFRPECLPVATGTPSMTSACFALTRSL